MAGEAAAAGEGEAEGDGASVVEIMTGFGRLLLLSLRPAGGAAWPLCCGVETILPVTVMMLRMVLGTGFGAAGLSPAGEEPCGAGDGTGGFAAWVVVVIVVVVVVIWGLDASSAGALASPELALLAGDGAGVATGDDFADDAGVAAGEDVADDVGVVTGREALRDARDMFGDAMEDTPDEEPSEESLPPDEMLRAEETLEAEMRLPMVVLWSSCSDSVSVLDWSRLLLHET